MSSLEMRAPRTLTTGISVSFFFKCSLPSFFYSCSNELDCGLSQRTGKSYTCVLSGRLIPEKTGMWDDEMNDHTQCGCERHHLVG